MGNYRKKPVEIKAVQYIKNVDTGFMGVMGPVFQDENIDWINESQIAWEPNKKLPEGKWWVVTDGLEIGTKEKVHLASPGDFIIKGIAGEIYPCKPDIFKKTYVQLITEKELINILGLDDEHVEDGLLGHYDTENGSWINDHNGMYRFEWSVFE